MQDCQDVLERLSAKADADWRGMPTDNATFRNMCFETTGRGPTGLAQITTKSPTFGKHAETTIWGCRLGPTLK